MGIIRKASQCPKVNNQGLGANSSSIEKIEAISPFLLCAK